MVLLVDDVKSWMNSPTDTIAYRDGQIVARFLEDARQVRIYVYADYFRVNSLGTQKVNDRHVISEWISSRYGKKDFAIQLAEPVKNVL